MGRYYLHFDPPGYFWCKELGYDAEVKGNKLLKLLGQPKAGEALANTSFYNPPNSEWLMPRPHQFTPDWQSDPAAILSDYVLAQSMWSFAGGVTVNEWNPQTRPGHAGAAANKWLSIIVPSSFTSLEATNFANLATAAGVTLPASVGTIATANATPSGIQLGSADFMPNLQWASLPAPQDLLIFGWLNYAILLYQDQGYFLVSPDASKTTWELRGRVQAGTKGVQGSMSSSPALGASVHALTALNVGGTEIFLFPREGMDRPAPVKIRQSNEARLEGVTGTKWWIASAPDTALNLQVQVVGFMTAESDLSAADVAFDLTEDYKPTQIPKLTFQTRMDINPAAPSEAESTLILGDLVEASTYTNQDITFGLRDEAHARWNSDGTHHKGFIYLKLVPGNPVTGPENRAYLTPQIRLVQFTFPVLLQERPHALLILNDKKWKDVETSSSLREVDGKRGVIRLWLLGASAFKAAGLHRRGSYPVEVREDVDNDGVAEVLRRVLWVSHPSLTRFQAEDPNDKDHFEIECQGLLSRTDRTSIFSPLIIDADGGGNIEHTFVVKQALLRSGFDTTDPAVVQIADDPLSGTGISQLPGTYAKDPGENGQTSDASWSMDEDETFRAYMERVAHEFSAWLIYENLAGVLLYHPNMRLDILGVSGTAQYFVSATLYRTHAEATAAGKPGQVYRPMGECKTIEPRANMIRVTGVGTNGETFPHVVERDVGSIETLPVMGVPSPNFVGEPKPRNLKPKLAVSPEAASQIAHVLLKTDVERLFEWDVECQLSPDDILPNSLDVGRMVKLSKIRDGADADCLIIHCHNHIVTSRVSGGHQVTQFTCEELPLTASAAANQGAWPGLGTA